MRSLVFSHTSIQNMARLTCSLFSSSLRASVDATPAIAPTMPLSTPAVSQVGVVPGNGISGKIQRRQWLWVVAARYRPHRRESAAAGYSTRYSRGQQSPIDQYLRGTDY